MFIEIEKFYLSMNQADIPVVEEKLSRWLIARGVDERAVTKAIIKTEDVIVAMQGKAAADATITITAKKIIKYMAIHISCVGEPISTNDIQQTIAGGLDAEESMVLQQYFNFVTQDEAISLKYKKGINIVDIEVQRRISEDIVKILASIILGIGAGLLLRLTGSELLMSSLDSYLFSPFMTMFMNALKLLIGPIVFFSISTSLAGFSDLGALGKWASKLMGLFVFTSASSFVLTFIAATLVPIGNASLINMVHSAHDLTSTAAAQQVSITNMIIGIVPNSLVAPFMTMDMLQIIFLAVLSGVVAATLPDKFSGFSSFLSTGAAVANRAMIIVMMFMPFMIFASMAQLFMSIEFSSLLSLLSWACQLTLLTVFVLVVYFIVTSIVLKKDIKKLISITLPVMMTAFSTASSSATMPTTLETATKKLHIDQKLASLGISLGTTIHMDGTVILILTAVLFVANIYGVSLEPEMIITLMFTVMALSMGAPGVPNAGIIIIVMVLMSINLPGDAVTLFLGIIPLIERISTICNATTDLLGTAMIAKTEGLIDCDRF